MRRRVGNAGLPDRDAGRRSAERMASPLAEAASSHAVAAALLDALPQTQCRRCGFADCRSYADAMAAGEADVNRCPPGGAEGVGRLARIVGRPARPLDADCGAEGPRSLAVIDEAACIGCALCLKACPVDAIVGAAKRMHTVVEASCTGCELCLPVCPVDCIALVVTDGELGGWQAWSAEQAETARARHAARQRRERQDAEAAITKSAALTESMRSRAVADALARAKARTASAG